MLKNHVIIAIRNFTKRPFYTLLNVLGLTVGITFSFLLFLVVWDEQNIDRFHHEGEQIYRAYFNGVNEQGEVTFTQAWSPFPLYTELRELDGVENAAYFDHLGELMLSYEGKAFKEIASWASPSLFEIFSFTLVEGQVKEAEKNPFSLFISEEVAERIFGESWKGNSVGELIKINETYDFTIAGVFEKVDKRSSHQFDMLMNIHALEAWNNQEWANNWSNKTAIVFAQLTASSDPRVIEDQISTIYKNNPGYGIGEEAIMLFPFEKNYLWTEFEKGIAIGGRVEYVRILFGAACFLLIIAIINFINLTTAQSTKRAYEVGVRKTVGAGRATLIMQFLTESGILVFSTILIALVACQFFLPTINELANKSIEIPFGYPPFWVILIGSGLFLTLLAGAYPSFVLSLFPAISTLKGHSSTGIGHKNVRRGLVVFQFILSAALIIASLVVHQQIHFIQHENLGLNRDQVIHINLLRNYRHKYPLFKQQLEASTDIDQVVSATHIPTNISWINSGFDWEGRDPEDGSYFYMMYTDFGFEELFDIKMKAGRFFDEKIKTDSTGLVINEKALDYIQLEDPVGKIVYDASGTPMKILGIAQNFHFHSLHSEIEPLMIRIDPGRGHKVLVRSKPNATKQAIARLETIWKELIPDYPLEYHFLDETYANMYQMEKIIGKIASYTAIIAILVSCLGLLGLVTFMAAQKTKEIGIRKVVGASVWNIVVFLSRDLFRLILIGLTIAMPLAWYGMEEWLKNYAYRIELQWWVFGITAITLLFLGFFTMIYQSVRAAMMDPVKSLRNE